jgi:hypothetical protein
MVLVPEQFMDMLERKESMQTFPVTKKMIRLDRRMNEILDDTSKSEDERVAQYNQNLQQFLDVQEKKRQYVPTVKIFQEKPSSPSQPLPPSDTPQQSQPVLNSNQGETSESSVQHPTFTDNDILDSVPKTSRTLARSMINRLKANRDQVSWNKRGELVIEGNPVAGSNIIDLINDQLKSRKDFNPTGWEQFTETLGKMNMPKYLMRNERRRIYLSPRNNQETPGSAEASTKYAFPPTPPTTPKSHNARPSRVPIPKHFSDDWITY